MAICWRGRNKEQLTRKVRSIINPQPMTTPFVSDFVSDLIAAKHYYCSVNSLRPTKLRKLPSYRDSYSFQGLFHGAWRGVSWRKCIYPPGRNARLATALRVEIWPVMMMHRDEHPTCQRCHESPALDVDHVQPEFREIVAKVAAALDQGDGWERAWAAHDWLEDVPFRLPEGPALQVFRAEHESAVLMSVCSDCHRLNAKDRKRRRNDMPNVKPVNYSGPPIPSGTGVQGGLFG